MKEAVERLHVKKKKKCKICEQLYGVFCKRLQHKKKVLLMQSVQMEQVP